MAAAVFPWPPWCPTPGATGYNNPPTFWASVVCVGTGNEAPWWPLSAIWVTLHQRTLWVGCGLWYIGMCRVLYQAIGDNLWMRWQWAFLLALEPLVQHPPHQIGSCAALSGQQHHWGMMRGGSSGKKRGIGPGDAFSYTMGFCTWINHGGRCCPTATMRPYSWHWSTQQSANMLGNRFVLLKLGNIIVKYVY